MSLTVIATPIGNYGDITLRAIESLKIADIIICEELKPARILLKRLGIEPLSKNLIQLNEHTRNSDLTECLSHCRTQKVALISDCGTPGFCDPGADLVDACLKEKIQVDVNPGASSLMTLLSIAGVRLDEFYFVGFLPAEKGSRQKKLDSLKNLKMPLIAMDTPYRLNATLEDFARLRPKAQAILGADLTGEHHKVLKGTCAELRCIELPKAPFVLIIR
jgi:16S rRNA (cytidine1402-2'-O)-methyltransferase